MERIVLLVGSKRAVSVAGLTARSTVSQSIENGYFVAVRNSSGSMTGKESVYCRCSRPFRTNKPSPTGIPTPDPLARIPHPNGASP